MSRSVVQLAIVAVLAAAGCGAATGAPRAASTAAPSPITASGSAALTVLGAASLRDALHRAEAAYESEAPGTTLTMSTDSSAALRTQIEQGAPADVFLSADTTNPRRLVDAGLADGDPVAFAANELTVIVPAGNPAGITSPADLARDGVKVIAAGDAVPIRAYATEVVSRLAGLDGYPADFARGYAGNVVSREDDVRAVVTKIELGEGDAALVYASDAAAAADRVEAIPLPGGANVTATYSGVVVAGSSNPPAARAFLAWMAEGPGQGILADLGFLPPATSTSTP